MLQLLEPQLAAWNKLMAPEELRELQADMQGSIVGIGVEIRFEAESGISDVLAVLPGSPAERAGMRDGDKILTVNGHLYKGKTLRDVVGDLRGKPGEEVKLTALRDAHVLSLSIRRERVAYDLVKPLLFPGSVGYLFIRQFTDGTPAAVESALGELSQKGAKSLVVDLRGNQGGLFEKAIATAELFLPKGTPVTKLRHRGGTIETLAAQRADNPVKWPLALLVDRETASSAELLAGALRDGAGAQVIGARTYGKGTVQRLEELPNGYAYKFTASHFMLPSGDAIEGRGLTPDLEVALALPEGRTYERQLSRVLHESDAKERLLADAPLRAAAHVLRLAAR
jgi:carboxyl-terminal processing protease